MPDDLERLRLIYWSCLHELNQVPDLDARQLGALAYVIPILRAMELLPSPDKGSDRTLNERLDEAEEQD